MLGENLMKGRGFGKPLLAYIYMFPKRDASIILVGGATPERVCMVHVDQAETVLVLGELLDEGG